MCQETIVSADFAIRDFEILDNNTLIYIEKRDIKSINLNTKDNDTLINKEGFFIGGYGLNIFFSKNQKKIITASNELVKDRSSIRFYDIEKKDINKHRVLYSKSLLDFHPYSKDSLLFLSYKDSTIKVYKYGQKPFFKKVDSFKVGSFSRKIKYYKEKLYYITDNGEIGYYDLIERNKKVIYNTSYYILNFLINPKREQIYATTLTGELVIVNLKKSKTEIIKLSNSVTEALEMYNNKYVITGNWRGEIIALNLNTFAINKLQNLKHRVLKVVVDGKSYYTSTAKKRIEKWNFNFF